MSAGKVAGLTCIGIIGLFVLGIFGFVAVMSFASGEFNVPGIALFAVIAVGLVIFLVVRLAKNRVAPEDRYRISMFARANGLTYTNTIVDPPLPGMIFRIGRRRTSSEVLRREHPRFVEFANYRFVDGYGDDATTRRWGYVAIKLDVPLPHIVLDALGNNSAIRSNLPASFDKRQRLSLEGDFDRYYALYCPQGYERDALYLFTPDVMALMIDAAPLDVEVVDDWLFLYSAQRICTADPKTWSRLLTTVDALQARLDQWARWRDDRLTGS